MKKLSYFLMVGLAFTVLQVATVSADTAAGLVTGANAPADCGGVPCPTGDDTHPCSMLTGDDLIKCTEENPPPSGNSAAGGPPPGEDCANKPTPEETAACWDQQGGHMDHPGGPDGHMGDPGCDPNLAPDAGGCPDGFQGKPHHDGPGGPNDHQPGMTGGPNDHRGPGGPGHHDGPPIDPRSGQPFTKADEDKYQKYADECEATRGLLSEGSTQELVADGFTRLQVEKLCKDGPDHHDGPPGGPDGHHDGPPGMPPQ